MITVDHLTKRYGAFTALDDVSFVARPGRVTGFLGPNGAGKTTAMRVVAGLTPAGGGSATVLGRPYAALPNPGRHVGLLLDASAQHAGRTGREVLTLGAVLTGVDRRRVGAMLDLVGLSEKEANRRVRNYSLGMRQRLGIAHALLADPEVLILDEPANGLDPAGIRWMRDLLRGFAARGGTVLLSSHLLNEIERVADDIIVIGNGKVVAQGTTEELLAGSGTVVRSTDDRALEAALRAGGVSTTGVATGGLLAETDPETVGRVALAAGVVLRELRSGDERGLEEMFLDLTAASAREEVAA
ncbi:ATP-binding cassette domain-containing protein [Phycicoccus sp.]|uniref:ABC transporter ATP-binding protein n=1 Tax=Phycicoccus sp. TaxID=1902410 RepID=UPI002BD9494B|nr:ATP-binding cassette domain-containing protein [Phycicoccus sp.]HMM95008.1 ATP-binding cassette domain-containing protein [Phycicoccus sp.]